MPNTEAGKYVVAKAIWDEGMRGHFIRMFSATGPQDVEIMVDKIEAEAANEKDKIITRYREYFLKIIIASGADAGDIDRPDQIAYPPIEELALTEVETLRKSYEEVLEEEVWKKRYGNQND